MVLTLFSILRGLRLLTFLTPLAEHFSDLKDRIKLLCLALDPPYRVLRGRSRWRRSLWTRRWAPQRVPIIVLRMCMCCYVVYACCVCFKYCLLCLLGVCLVCCGLFLFATFIGCCVMCVWMLFVCVFCLSSTSFKRARANEGTGGGGWFPNSHAVSHN